MGLSFRWMEAHALISYFGPSIVNGGALIFGDVVQLSVTRDVVRIRKPVEYIIPVVM